MNNTNKIYNSDGCITDKYLILFAQNKVYGQDSALIRKHLEHCAMCRDMVDGYLTSKSHSEINKAVISINNNIDKQLGIHKPKIINFSSLRAIAAVVTILITSSVIYYQFFVNDTAKLAQEINPVSEEATVIYTDTAFTIPEQPNVTEDLAHSRTFNEKTVSDNVITDINTAEENVLTKDNQIINTDENEVTLADDVISKSDEDIPEFKQRSMIKTDVPDNKEATINSAIAENYDKGISVTDEIQIDPVNNSVYSESQRSKKRENKQGKTLEAKVTSKPNGTLLGAVALINAENYQEAFVNLNEIIANNPSDMEAYAYLGICNYYLNQYPQSLTNFSICENYITSALQYDVKYFKALSLLKTGNTTEAKNILQNLSLVKSNYQQNALNLLKDLK